jgi:hypothetical protein
LIFGAEDVTTLPQSVFADLGVGAEEFIDRSREARVLVAPERVPGGLVEVKVERAGESHAPQRTLYGA